MKKYLFLWLILPALLIEPVSALTKYGTARIQNGELTVIRDNQENVYVPGNGNVDILVNDVIRVGKNSLVVIDTVEQTNIRMGDNAVFQVRPWKTRGRTGYLRMLYGKMNFETKKLPQRRRFRFKTAARKHWCEGDLCGL